MTTVILITPNRRAIAVRPFCALRRWLRSRAAQVAVDRLDDHLRRDIGLPARGDRLVPRHEAVARVVLMNLR